MRVVLTRSREDLGAYARALAPRFTAVALPVLVEVALTAEEIDALMAAVSCPGPALLWLASARAVAPAVAALQTAGIALPRAVTVGERTAAAARAAGLAAESLGDDAVAAASALVARGLEGTAVIAPRAAGGRDDGLAILTAAGAQVRAATAYRLAPRAADDPALTEGLAALPTAAAVLVFAPSQAAALLALCPTPPPCVAIGATTAAALRERGVPPAAVATRPTPAAMAAALAAVYPTDP
ncbi:MAG: uroporphyrinogen-III synthase [Kofleriaceae bacterium]|nr:uroporphyrinogen-III synthase [Kofleriaceae bacterium]MBP9167028.1 uroporphyrinogen-III synthase [Kofleriaceae bacterium]MBP9858339.1 uroporphyrinogen-III synthase [Kofleriaceae bacterium]